VLGLLEIHLRTLIMTGPFTAAVIALLLFGIRYEALGLQDQFRKEAASGSGTILMDEVPVLVSPWQRLKQRLRAFTRGGFRAYFKVARLQSAQLDLAMERWHRERREMETPMEAEESLRQRVLELRRAAAAPLA
jgi:hypothetical protein